jgi:hypothetical protein
MDCAAINAEVQANTKKIAALGSEEGSKVAQNVAAGVIGIVIWPVWFGMDFQNAAGKEVVALQSRQQYLATLAEQRCGAVPPLPIQSIPQASPPGTTDAGAVPQSTPGQAPVSPPVQAPAPAAPAATSASAEKMAHCIDSTGAHVLVAGDTCPAPWKPAQ